MYQKQLLPLDGIDRARSLTNEKPSVFASLIGGEFKCVRRTRWLQNPAVDLAKSPIRGTLGATVLLGRKREFSSFFIA